VSELETDSKGKERDRKRGAKPTMRPLARNRQKKTIENKKRGYSKKTPALSPLPAYHPLDPEVGHVAWNLGGREGRQYAGPNSAFDARGLIPVPVLQNRNRSKKTGRMPTVRAQTQDRGKIKRRPGACQ
jgi:hypothetical protein